MPYQLPRAGVYYEAPVEGVLISEDAELLSAAAVQEASAERRAFADIPRSWRVNDAIAANVSGQPIQTLAKGASPDLLDFLGMGADLKSALTLAAQAIAIVYGAGAAVVVTIGALRYLGILDQEPNPFDDLYARIQKHLKEQLRATYAGATASTMQNIADLVGHAETAGQIVGQHLGNPTKQTSDLLPQADYWSRYAVNTLSKEAYWLRPFDPAAIPGPAGPREHGAETLPGGASSSVRRSMRTI